MPQESALARMWRSPKTRRERLPARLQGSEQLLLDLGDPEPAPAAPGRPATAPKIRPDRNHSAPIADETRR